MTSEVAVSQDPAAVKGGTAKSDKALILGFVAAIVESGESAVLDSHMVADALWARRNERGDAETTDWSQTRDYVQHVLREAAHVCRYADGFSYRVHLQPACSETCQNKKRIAAKTVRREICDRCFLERTYDLSCPSGCDD